jgi:hypothetical protein
MRDAAQLYLALVTQLRRFQRKLWLADLAEVFFSGLIAALVLVWCWVAVEAALYLAPGLRVTAGVVAALLSATAVGFLLAKRLSRHLSVEKVALLIEEQWPQLRQRLITSLELGKDHRSEERFSTTLFLATLQRAVDDLHALDPRPLLRRREIVSGALRAAAVALVAIGSLVVFDDTLGAAAVRCTHPLTVFERTPGTRIYVTFGDSTVIAGENFPIRVRFEGDLPHAATILSREGTSSEYGRQRILVAGADSLNFTFESVKRSFVFVVEANDGKSAIHEVAVIDPPVTEKIRVRYQYPEYSGLAAAIEEETGDLRCLRGTRVDIEIFASKPLAAAALVLNDSIRIQAEITDTRARAAFTVDSAGSYVIALRDRFGVANRKPIRYSILALEDAFPQISITEPGRNMDLPDDMEVTLGVEAADDYGISRLMLVYRVNDRPPAQSAMKFTPDSAVRVQREWDLSTWDLLPEDQIHYRVDAFDNDGVAGPKKSSSAEFSLRFPSIQELFDEVRDAQKETLDRLETISEESSETGEYLEELRRELVKKESLSWEQEKELESTLEQETERAQAIEELAREIDEAMTAMKDSGLATEELLEKMAELSKLMESVMSPQMQEALAALQDAAKSQDPKRLAEALRKFAEDHQLFEERLDRSISLLARVQVEQRLQAAVKRAQDLEKRQSQINAGMDLDLGDPRLPQHELALQRDADGLQDELSELGELMDEYSEKTAENLERQSTLMEQENLSGRMQEVTQLLEAPANTKARKKGSELHEDLGKLAHNMQRLQGEYTEEQKGQLAEAMRAAIHQLLRLSERQESVAEETRLARADDSVEIAENQFAVAQGTVLVVEKLASVARRTMSLGYGLATSLGYAMHHMGQATDLLGRRQLRGTDEQQVTAMGYLNESILLLRKSMENLADAGLPSAFDEAMQKMAGMAEKQSDINQATQEAFGQQGREAGELGRVNASHRRRMERLATEQRSLYEALKALERSLRGHRGAEERTRAMEREMETVVQDLQGPRLPKRTLDLQNRILQRMLDASRSIHNRGYEKQRESESGGKFEYTGPPWLPADKGESEDLLREAMRNALAGSYPEEYRRLIRSYYERVYQDATSTPGVDP